jgi:putative endopeptidase
MAFMRSIHAAVERRLRQASWPSDSTRAHVLRKIAQYTEQIGAPPLTTDYSTLDLSATDYAHNRQAIKDFLYQQQLKAIGDNHESWMFRPYVLNATENESNSAVEVPAVLWTSPLYDPTGDPAANYGALGMLVSHEFMHAFGTVNRVWLDTRDESTFTARTQRLVQQANAYAITMPNGEVRHLDGMHTLEENLADLDGIRVAYDAFLHTGAVNTNASHTGFTPAQRFFLAFANLMREKEVREHANDTHAPKEFRVNGTLSNMPEFAQAFGCKDGDPMVRPISQRVEVW